ncbi:MAG: family 16 glycosylhydrolase, partial [Thermotogota bacterium]
MQKFKRNLSLLLALLLTLSFVSAAGSDENMLGNGQFEENVFLVEEVKDNGGGDFETENNWLFLENAGSASAEIDNGMFKTAIVNGGSNSYSIQLLQAPIEIKEGYKYKVQFDAKASKTRELEVKIGGSANRGWSPYNTGKGETGGFVADLEQEMKHFEFEFVMTQETDPRARFEFQLGKDTGTIWLDNISLTEIGEVASDEIPEAPKKEWVYNKDFFFIFNVAVGGNLGGRVDTTFPKEMFVDYIRVYDLAGYLKWEDNFNEENVNEDYWSYEVGNGHKQGIPGWGNNELQYYTAGENARVEDGNLIITVKEEPRSDQYGSYNYTSTRMITKDKVTTKYGRIEIRAKLPEGQGLWPAFWMLGSDIADNPWPDCGEIDIMEFIAGQVDTVHGTVHGPNHFGGNGITQHYQLETGNFVDDYHTFTFEWTVNEMRWYIDDQEEPYHVVKKTANNETVRAGEVKGPQYTKNQVVNGDFNSAIADKMNTSPDNWYVWTGEGGAVGEYGVEKGEFKINVTSLGNQTWAVQFAQYIDLDP